MFNDEKIFEIIKWITPVILFFLGFLIKWFYNKITACFNRKELRRYIYHTTESLISKIDKQIAEIDKCINKLNDIDENNIILAEIAGNELNELIELPSDKYYELFIQKSKGQSKIRQKLLRKFRNNLDYLSKSYKGLVEYNRKVDSIIRDFTNDFNQRYISLINMQNRFISDNN